MFRISRGGHLLLDGNTKGYKVSDNIATKVEVHPQMLSTLKITKYIYNMHPVEKIETSVFGPLGVLLSSQRQESFCPNCLLTFKTNSLSQIIHQNFD